MHSGKLRVLGFFLIIIASAIVGYVLGMDPWTWAYGGITTGIAVRLIAD